MRADQFSQRLASVITRSTELDQQRNSQAISAEHEDDMDNELRNERQKIMDDMLAAREQLGDFCIPVGNAPQGLEPAAVVLMAPAISTVEKEMWGKRFSVPTHEYLVISPDEVGRIKFDQEEGGGFALTPSDRDNERQFLGKIKAQAEIGFGPDRRVMRNSAYYRRGEPGIKDNRNLKFLIRENPSGSADYSHQLVQPATSEIARQAVKNSIATVSAK